MGTLSVPCPHCRHDKSVFTAVWNENFKKTGIWQVYLRCVHCDKGIAALMTWKPHPGIAANTPVNIAHDLTERFNVIETWPLVAPLSAPLHTPGPVARRFVEGEDAFGRRNWNSAVGMYRSALDIATKGMLGVPAGMTFYKRLEWMFDNGKITKDIREWADHVRVEGNDALHDPDEFTEDDSTALRFFTEMFLRYVFELPGRVTDFRTKHSPKP